ncbi:AhpC/TSA family protein [Reichenbachiella faecimaris]|uniref:AhpC/TSA family protein n=1 Tax=Reichenbachiella faecimaris TaxID=692418 RepID=A0A1W2GBT0_REIFA|nr:thioredoxin family protein [Reichenbachiella faecimaris]SMD33798.1 AhpC/TSA family protein [Reichenbachiella faecimaris]
MKKNILLVFGLVAVAAVLFASGNKEEIVKPKVGFEVGDKATDFKLKNVDGKTISMTDYKDAKGFIVVFTCNTCPFSKMYEKRIDLLNQKYEPQGFPVIAINSNDVTKQPGDSFEEMTKRAQDKAYSFPYLYDESQAVATAYGATRTPHVYVLNKNTKGLTVAYIGAIDDNHKDADAVTQKYVEDAVDSLLGGKAVKTASTKAIGCTIKWKEA